jgi:hypothetical protein
MTGDSRGHEEGSHFWLLDVGVRVGRLPALKMVVSPVNSYR